MKKGKGLHIVGLIFMFLGFLTIGAGGGYYYFNMKNSDNSNKEEVKEEPKDTKNTTVISFANSNFSIPEDVDYQIEGEQLILAGDTWYAIIMEYPYSYKAFYEQKDEYKELLEKDTRVENFEEIKINSNKYLNYKVYDEKDGYAYIAIKEYTNTSSLLIIFFKDNGTQLQNDDLKNVDDIISTAEIRTTKGDFDRNLINFNKILENINAE